jgi:hypothetical protein
LSNRHKARALRGLARPALKWAGEWTKGQSDWEKRRPAASFKGISLLCAKVRGGALARRSPGGIIEQSSSHYISGKACGFIEWLFQTVAEKSGKNQFFHVRRNVI